MFRKIGQVVLGAFVVAVASSSSAQAETTGIFIPEAIKPCSTLSTNLNEKTYSYCHDLPDSQFYSQAFVYFAVENKDLNRILQNNSKKSTFISNLRSLLVRNKDTAYFILRLTARDAFGKSIPLGVFPLLSIKRNGSNDYSIARDIRIASLPTRFIANESSQIYADIGVLVERQGVSQIANALGAVAKLAGVSLPIPGQLNITDEQVLLKKSDELISGLLSSSGTVATFVPLTFRSGQSQAFETSTTLERYLPEQAIARLIVASSTERSVFPAASRLAGLPLSEAAAPGGSVSNEILSTSLDGKTAWTLIVSQLGQEAYNALRSGTSESEYVLACQHLEELTSSGKLGLTSDDSNRLRWAVMAGNPILPKSSVRASACVAPLIATWSKLGLGSPKAEAPPLPNDHRQLLAVSRAEVQRARAIVEQAISLRDRARTAAEAAYRRAPGTMQDPSLSNGRYSFAGQALEQQPITLGVLKELASDRLGNSYEGEFLYVGNDVIFQGFGQYASARSSDGIGYREYVGTFAENFGSGHGRITYHDGASYTGQTSRERAHGFGVKTDAAGGTIYAKFVDGKPEGLAVRIESNGKAVAGDMLPNGSFHPLEE